MTIDTTKPLESADGRHVRFLRFDCDGDLIVEVKGEESGMDRVFHADGRHFFGELPELRNVIEGTQGVMVIPRTIDEWDAFFLLAARCFILSMFKLPSYTDVSPTICS